MSTPAPASASTPRRKLRRRATAVVVLLLVVALAATVGWLATTTNGLRAAIALVNRVTPATIEATGARGALAREFGFDQLAIVVARTRIEITDLRARLRDYALRPLRFDFESLAASRVAVAIAPAGEPGGPPESIAAPVAVTTQRLAVGAFELGVGKPVLALRAIDATVALGPDGYRVADGRFEWGALKFTFDGTLGGRTPFALAARGDATAALLATPVRAQWRVAGSLRDFTVEADLSGGAARGSASARIGSFDAPALKSLQADVDGVDLAAWREGLPHTRLQVKADLRPDAALTSLSGPVHVVNRAAGTIDAQKIPLREAAGEVVVTRAELRADRLAIDLTRGRAEGSFGVKFDAGAAWQTELRLSGVDPAGIHSRARPLLLDGSVRARQAVDESFVLADLRHRGTPAVSANLDLRVTKERIDFRRADLTLGGGRASATGTLGLAGVRRVSAKGWIDRFDPALLVTGVDALISGDFEADAQLAPAPSGQVRFELRDSRAFGRPMSGRGLVRLDGAEQLDVDVALAVRSARVTAQGGLGAPGRTLAVAIDAPALAELLPSVQGSLKADATFSGAWNAPAVDARAVVGDLRVGEHSVQQAQAVATYSGGADGRLALQAGLAGHAFRDPALSLRTATIVVEGLLSRHAISVRGTTASAQAATLLAQGGWSNRTWRGTLREAATGAPLDLRLLIPAPLAIDADGFDFGPARFALVGAQFEDVRVAGDRAGLRTSGSFSGLRPTDLAASTAPGNGVMIRSSAPLDLLSLRGQWQFTFGAVADGNLRIERSGGDLYAGAAADTGLRLRDVTLEAVLKANRLDARAVIAGERSGTLHARMNALVERAPDAGWRPAQQQPWQIDADADLPSLAWVNAVLSERVRANVRLDGRLAGQIRIAGTPARPQARGAFTADALRVAWVEQGMRLENGRLRAHLDNDVIVLDELRFSGPPRVRPKDKRAAERLDFTREGSVTATGRLRVRDLDGVIQVAAERLPLLQRPDRWVLASGGANIEMSVKRVQLNGAFAAVAGYVDFSRAELPSLSSDVIVLRAQDEAAPRAPRVALGFDVGIDLGEAFYVRGGGLDTRVEGAVRLRSDGRGAVTAAGTIEAKDGTYEGFGQRLAIVRGRLNFQGPPENPGLDVLAVRRELPVEVGVTITRTASNPLIRLYSDPPLPDYETLSWLVLGRAAEQSRADNLALAQAATSLLAGGGEGMPSQLARALGIDEFTLRSGELRDAGSLLPRRSVAGALRGDTTLAPGAATEIITIGKRVSDAITISYEQALAGTASIVQLSYRLSQRVSLVARGGSDNALDLVYSIAFD